MTALVNGYEPALRALQPSADRVVEVLDRHRAGRLAGTIPRLPGLIDFFDDLMPTSTACSVAPDIQHIVGALEELGQVLSGVPGVDRLRKRAESVRELISSICRWPPTSSAGCSAYTAMRSTPSSRASGSSRASQLIA